jgi:predicted dehydrogenase
MVNIAIIGSGGIASKHVEALMNIEDAKIISTFDVVEEKAQQLADVCGAKAYTDLDAAIDKSDLVYILTPPSFHKDIAVHVMKSGRHVMIEKPISISIEDADAMVEASIQYNKKAMVGFNMRFRPGYIKLKEMYDSGQLGSVLNLWSQRMGMNSPRNNWRTNPEMLSGFTVESLSHDIDMFQWITGAKVTSVYGSVQNSRADLPGYDDNSLVILNFDNGTSASIQASWSSYLEFNSRGITGTEGTAMISGHGTWNFDTYKYRTKSMENELAESFEDTLSIQSYFEENKHFIDCVMHDKTPEMTVGYGLEILKVSRAILDSSSNNKVIKL